MGSPYRYQPLDETRREIRLIRMIRAPNLESPSILKRLTRRLKGHSKDNQAIRIRLDRISLDQPPPYVAVSYAWGDHGRKKTVIVEENGQELEILVGENLCLALSFLCPLYPVLWADAVCINQEEDDEKSRQVQEMWNIYHHATSVAAWLGVNADDSHALFDQIATLGRQQSEAVLHWARNPGSTTPPESDFNVDFFPSIPAFTALAQRPYWQRLWVQQEIRASSEVWVHCEQKRIKIEWLSFVLQLFMAMKRQAVIQNWNGLYDSAPPERDTLESHMLDVKDTEFEAAVLTLNFIHTRAPLVKLLRQAFGIGHILKCTDPRDRIYALLGFASDASNIGIRPDYSKMCLQIYTQAAIALIKRDMLVLTLHNKSSDGHRLTGLPSWAPDWSRPFEKSFLLLTQENTGYRAAGSTLPDFDFLDLPDVSVVLSAAGCIFDLIAHPEPDDDSGGFEPIQALGDFERLGRFDNSASCSVFLP